MVDSFLILNQSPGRDIKAILVNSGFLIISFDVFYFIHSNDNSLAQVLSENPWGYSHQDECSRDLN